MSKEFINTQEICDRFGVAACTPRNWEKRGQFPKSFTLGSKRLWVRADVEKFLAEKGVTNALQN